MLHCVWLSEEPIAARFDGIRWFVLLVDVIFRGL